MYICIDIYITKFNIPLHPCRCCMCIYRGGEMHGHIGAGQGRVGRSSIHIYGRHCNLAGGTATTLSSAMNTAITNQC